MKNPLHFVCKHLGAGGFSAEEAYSLFKLTLQQL